MQKIELTPRSWMLIGQIPDSIELPFAELWSLKPTIRSQVKVFNKKYDAPRWSNHYLKPYKYSGVVHGAQPLPSALEPLFSWAKEELETEFNQGLINFYDDGNDYIGRHSDNEPEIVPCSSIFSCSFGATRTFRVRDKITRKIVHDLKLTDRTFIVMCGRMQMEYTHEVPKISGRRAQLVGPRINVTFRCFK